MKSTDMIYDLDNQTIIHFMLYGPKKEEGKRHVS